MFSPYCNSLFRRYTWWWVCGLLYSVLILLYYYKTSASQYLKKICINSTYLTHHTRTYLPMQGYIFCIFIHICTANSITGKLLYRYVSCTRWIRNLFATSFGVLHIFVLRKLNSHQMSYTYLRMYTETVGWELRICKTLYKIPIMSALLYNRIQKPIHLNKMCYM